MNEPHNCRPVPPFLFSGINCAAPSTTDINQALITAGNRVQPRAHAARCRAMYVITVNVLPGFFLHCFFFIFPFFNNIIVDRYQIRACRDVILTIKKKLIFI